MSKASTNSRSSKPIRVVLSFIMCFFIVLTSAFFTANISLINADTIESIFTDESYVNGLRQNVKDYALDLYMKNGISSDNLDEICDYSKVQDVCLSYIGYYVNDNKGYSQSSYEQNIDEISNALLDDISSQPLPNGYDSSSEICKEISDDFSQYFKSEVQISHIDYLKTFVNIGSTASLVGTIITVIITFCLALILLFVGKKRYHCVRSISASFFAGGLIDLLFACICLIITSIKNVNIYPLYLKEAFMQYVYFGIGQIALAGGILVIIALVILAIAWKLKRKDI